MAERRLGLIPAPWEEVTVVRATAVPGGGAFLYDLEEQGVG